MHRTSQKANAHFNPRSPHGERLLGATAGNPGGDFNPRSPHGERLTRDGTMRVSKYISTHAPRTGSDENQLNRLHELLAFQPTLPARGATRRYS